MDSGSIGLLVAYILLVFLSAFFSASETAFTTANRVRLKTLAASGSKKAEKAIKLAENDRLLSTLLVGNNIVNITVTTIATILFTRLILNQNLAVTLSTIITAVVVLIFGEVTPKTLAADKPESFCLLLYPLVKAAYYILLPINSLFILWKKLLKKVFKLKRDKAVTEDELLTYVSTAESDGEIDEHESKLIRSAIEFDDLDVVDVMTPRVNIIAIEESEKKEEIINKFVESAYSRFPVYSKTIDSIIGIIHEKDLLTYNKDEFVIKDILQNSICVSKNMKISNALRSMQKAKTHMAVVVDEYGGTSGIITMEDIIEELVGEIWDEHDEIEILLKKIDDNTFIVSGLENLESMFEALGFNDNEEFDSTTVGGWVTEQLQKIPLAGETFDYKNLSITVTKATVKKVAEIKIVVNEPKDEETIDQKKN